MARPRAALRALRRFPSRNATVSPTGKRLTAKGMGRQSTTEIPAARNQYAAGPANGKRRRAKMGVTDTATAGSANQSVRAEAGESRPMISSSIATTASTAISPSNQ